MHRRIEIDWALSNMTPKAVPAAPLGLLARQCHADADVDTAAAIVAPTNIAMRKRLMIALRSAVFLLTALVVRGHLVVVSADATIPSRTAARMAHGGSGHASTVDHDHTGAATHTGLRDHAVGLIGWRERHCLCGGSERQPEQSKRYCFDHCFLPAFHNSFVWSPRIASGTR